MNQKPEQKKPNRPQLPRAALIRRRAFTALTVISAVIVVAWVVSKLLFVEPNLPVHTPSPPPSGVDLSVEEGPRVSGDRKSDHFYTFLIVGRDTGGGGLTDTIMLASYDLDNQKLSVLNIPRDTMVNIPWDIKRINAVYNYYGGGEEGIAALKTEVSQLVGFVPDFDVIIEWEAVGKLVEAVGGVYFDVPRNMDYDDPTQDLHIHIQKGEQRLDGEQAMGVIRWRHNNNMTLGYPDGDIGRIKTQQEFLKAVISQVLQVKNATKILEFSNIFNENVETDLTVQNLFYFGKAAILGGLKMDDVQFFTLPANTNGYAWSRSTKRNQSYVLPYADEVLALINEHFNPYREDVTASMLDVMRVNADGSLSSSTGRVEDRQAALPPVSPTPTPTTTQSPPPPDVTAPPETPAPEPTPGEEEPTDPGAPESPPPAPPVQTPPPTQPPATSSPAAGGETTETRLLPPIPQPAI